MMNLLINQSSGVQDWVGPELYWVDRRQREVRTELQGGDKHVSCHLHLGRSQSFSSVSSWINSHLSSKRSSMKLSGSMLPRPVGL